MNRNDQPTGRGGFILQEMSVFAIFVANPNATNKLGEQKSPHAFNIA
jgi:hypothetical protein